MKIKTAVASHKPYAMPADPMYVPVQAGALGKDPIEGFQPDSTGVNISDKNPYYSELTVLYWAWKNMDADYIGLAHYRRHFKGKKGKTPIESVLTTEQAEKLLQKADVIVPKKRNYWIETVYSHYGHTHYASDLDETRQILTEIFPQYIPAFDKQMKSTKAHMFNMMIMPKKLLDEYCSFLFPVLFELENRIDYKNYSGFQGRVFGRISELLLDVWMNTNHISYVEVPMISMEKVNWFRKGSSFLKAKFFGKKYDSSF